MRVILTVYCCTPCRIGSVSLWFLSSIPIYCKWSSVVFRVLMTVRCLRNGMTSICGGTPRSTEESRTCASRRTGYGNRMSSCTTGTSGSLPSCLARHPLHQSHWHYVRVLCLLMNVRSEDDFHTVRKRFLQGNHFSLATNCRF